MSQAVRRASDRDLHLWLTPEVYERVSQAIRGTGKNRTDYVRDAILEKLARDEEAGRNIEDRRAAKAQEKRDRARNAFQSGIDRVRRPEPPPAAPPPPADGFDLDQAAKYIVDAGGSREEWERRETEIVNRITAQYTDAAKAKDIARALDQRVANLARAAGVKPPEEPPAPASSILPKGGLRGLLPDLGLKL